MAEDHIPWMDEHRSGARVPRLRSWGRYPGSAGSLRAIAEGVMGHL